MDVHPTKNVSIGIDPYPHIFLGGSKAMKCPWIFPLKIWGFNMF
jgi:hypothetical protein